MGKKAKVLGVIGGVVGGVIGGPAGAAALGGAAAQAGAGLDAADEGLAAAGDEMRLRKAQARETLRRARINIEATRTERDKFTGRQVTALAASNIDLSSQSSLLLMEEAQAQYARDIAEMDRDAHFQAEQLIRTGQLAVNQARSNKRAAIIGGVAGVVGAFGNMSLSGGSSAKGGSVGGTNTANTTVLGGAPRMTNI